MLTEPDFVRRLARQFPVRPPVMVGIGDDGAVLANPDGSQTVIVTDMLLDGVHFDLSTTSAKLVGRKSIAVNLSDLAAMACRPTAAFISIAVPNSTPSDAFLTELYSGIEALADEFEFTIAGGDTNSWNGPFAVNVCMTGIPFQHRPILRSGAKPGDVLAVTGPLGGSLSSGRHLTFQPRVELVKQLSTKVPIHALMDISDGLAIDLHRMMEASGTGATLNADDIPIHADVPESFTPAQRLHAALSDGEDFELLIALPPDAVDKAERTVTDKTTQRLSMIGTVLQGRGCRLINTSGAAENLAPSGWQHLS